MPGQRMHNGFPVADSLPRLHEAAMEDDQSLLRRTLRHQPNVNVYWDGEMALHVACRLGHYTIASTLIDHGASVTAFLMYRVVLPLGVAIENSQKAMARLLVDKGKCLQGPLGQHCGVEGLLKCAAIGDNETHNYLLRQACINLNDEGAARWTPLLIAINYGRTSMVKSLLEAGADLQIRRPLHLAIYRHHTAITRMLLDYKANANLFSKILGCYPLHTAVEVDGVEIVEMLLKVKCDLKVLSQDGKTPLYLACELGFSRVAHELLRAGACPNLSVPSTGNCPVIAAMTKPLESLYLNPNKSIPEIVLILIQAGANVDQMNLDGISPLDFAFEHKLFQVANMLMAADCYVKPSPIVKKYLIDSNVEEEESEVMKLYWSIVWQVPGLMCLCRRVVRTAVRVWPIRKAILTLPLPTAMQEYLMQSTLQNIADPKNISMLFGRI